MKKKGRLKRRILLSYMNIVVIGLVAMIYSNVKFWKAEQQANDYIKTYATVIQSNSLTAEQAQDMYDYIVNEKEDMHHANTMLLVNAAGFIIISIILSIVLSRRISKPIVNLKYKLVEAEKKNDLTTQFSIKSKDDIEEMANALNAFIRKIRSSLFEVSDRSLQMVSSMNTVSNSIENLNKYINDISGKTEDISAGMQETAASTQEVNATIEEINAAVLNFTEKSREGEQTAVEINERAKVLKENFSESQRRAEDMLTNIKVNLGQAIEESKEVEQIKNLANSILEITKQTNLLALNASIEAARAGEAGRGFAIVADEIGKLAENSAATANQIQRVSEIVMNSVSNLSENANSILQFVSNDVQDDYRSMLVATNDYSKDAVSIKDMITELTDTTEQLLLSIESVSSVISQVAISTNDGAEGTTIINNKAVEIVHEVQEVVTETANVTENATLLAEAMTKFKI
ncbi:MAG: methyl-accepting chemotaxis protein [Clostridiales bacterium]|nr:methyl-accepting chemotaxis protein [Clostridiales bacterium]